jgi:hypothetical protein
VSVNRRYSHGFLLGANYTRSLSLTGNTGLTQRFTYSAPGAAPQLCACEAAYEALNNKIDAPPDFLKLNSTWTAPGVRRAGGFVHQLTKDWTLSGVLTVSSGAAYTPGFSYQSNGGNVNLTGSPDFAAAAVIAANIGSGCSTASRFTQFNTSAVTGPTYGSTGMESGRNLLRGCPTAIVDNSLVRNFHFWKFEGARTFEFRFDVFNSLNAEFITGRNSTATFNNPTSMTLQNAQFNADGTIATGKSLPMNAGFGAGNAANASRNVQFEVRLAF